MAIMTAPRYAARPAWLPKFKARDWQTIDDSGLDTNEELDNSETDITMDADASSILAAGDVIHIEAEDMQVVSVSTVTVTVVRGYAGSAAVTHVTNTDVFLTNTANTVLWLPGQDDAFSSTIRDRSGNENNGTLTGTTWVKNDKGLTVLNFDGDDKVRFAANITHNLTEVSFIAWVRNTALAGNDHIWSQHGTNIGDDLVIIRTETATPKFYTSDTGNESFEMVSGPNLSVNVWHFIVATYASDNTQILYVDAVAGTPGIGQGLFATPAEFLQLGRNDDFNEPWVGQIWGGRILTRALTQAQITDMRNQERGLFGV